MTAVLVHEVPSRIRFRVQGLRHDTRRAALVRDRVAAVPGVAAASASPLTGSVIITHDGQAATRERIATTLAACGHSILPNAAAVIPQYNAAPAAMHPLIYVLAETLLECLLRSALAA